MAYLSDENQEAHSVAFVGVGVAIWAVGTFKPKLFKPKWSAEANRMHMPPTRKCAVSACYKAAERPETVTSQPPTEEGPWRQQSSSLMVLTNAD